MLNKDMFIKFMHMAAKRQRDRPVPHTIHCTAQLIEN